MKSAVRFLFLLLPGISLKAAAQLPEVINQNLDNFEITESFADTANFKTKNIFSVRYYSKPDKKPAGKNVKNIGGTPVEVTAYAEYLPDGRRTWYEYYSGNKKYDARYYYDPQFKNLLLIERPETETLTWQNWLRYNDKGLLERRIRCGNHKGRLQVDAYTTYSYRDSGAARIVRITGYNSDTIADPVAEYRFSGSTLVKSRPLYQSKVQRFRMIRHSYKPVETQGYIFNDRQVRFTYDDNGFITSEVWQKPEGTLENKTEYFYSREYTECIEQQYHMKGTEKSLKTVRLYNAQGDLVFEQSTEYTGNLLGIESYTYTYDDKNNWIEKRKYYQPCNNGVYGKKQQVAFEAREIVYYQTGQVPKVLPLPHYPAQLAVMLEPIPAIAAKKQQQQEAFDAAVASGNYDETIKITSAATLAAFTPAYWTVRDSAFGDLDGVEGDEAVMVYKTPMQAEMGSASCVAVFRKTGGLWTLWYQTLAPLLGDQNGGMMGDPYSGVAVARRCIVIQHFGGSRQKWQYTHRYRFQNEHWYLIGATVHFGAPCDYMQQLDYNLSTGEVVVKYTAEACNNKGSVKESGWTERMQVKRPLPLMDAFIPGETELALPKRKQTLYY
ncbi:MAG: hypothetical protein J7599_03350 [Niabella sp.]|nr:hypothetical protein [Niabella sp.]